MSELLFTFTATVRLWNNGESPASRYFITVPLSVSDAIKQQTAMQPRKGWGSVKVEVRIGFYTRKTSIFPDKKSGSYLLPIKVEVRKVLHIGEGDEVAVQVCVL